MQPLTKDLSVVLAPNPSALTGPGTNTYLLGQGARVVIDPGPDDPAHLDAVVKAADGRIAMILVTHAHRDHSAGAARLAQWTGAPVLAFGGALDGRSARMEALADQPVGGGEGLDHDFIPDHRLADRAVIDSPAGPIEALHTPGHAGSHLCFRWGSILFCGDIVLGWTSTLISPPDGDLSDYLRSMARIGAAGAQMLYPGHGAPITEPAARILELLAHRRQRTAQILAALRERPDSAAGLALRLYDVPAQLLPAAERNVLAHLIALHDIGALDCQGELSATSRFRPV